MNSNPSIVEMRSVILRSTNGLVDVGVFVDEKGLWRSTQDMSIRRPIKTNARPLELSGKLVEEHEWKKKQGLAPNTLPPEFECKLHPTQLGMLTRLHNNVRKFREPERVFRIALIAQSKPPSKRTDIEKVCLDELELDGWKRKRGVSLVGIHLCTWDGIDRTMQDTIWAVCHYPSTKARMKRLLVLLGIVALGAAAVYYTKRNKPKDDGGDSGSDPDGGDSGSDPPPPPPPKKPVGTISNHINYTIAAVKDAIGIRS